jgi:hypothetical protein
MPLPGKVRNISCRLSSALNSLKRQIRAVCALLLPFAAFALGGCGETRDSAAPAGPLNESSSDTSITCLELTFESGIEGRWVRSSSFGPLLDIEPRAQGRDDYNLSCGYVHLKTPQGSKKGGMQYRFPDNSIEPIPVTRDTRVFWSWYALSSEETNGLWVFLGVTVPNMNDTLLVRCVNWRQTLRTADLIIRAI